MQLCTADQCWHIVLLNSCAHMNSYLFKLLTFVERSVCSPRPTPQSEKQPAQLEKLHECTSPLHWSIVVDSWPASCMHGLLCAMPLEMCHFLTHATFYTPDMITACTCHVVSPVVPWEISCVDSFNVTYPWTPCMIDRDISKWIVRTYTCILSVHNFICNASVSEGLLQAYNAYKTSNLWDRWTAYPYGNRDP